MQRMLQLYKAANRYLLLQRQWSGKAGLGWNRLVFLKKGKFFKKRKTVFSKRKTVFPKQQKVFQKRKKVFQKRKKVFQKRKKVFQKEKIFFLKRKIFFQNQQKVFQKQQNCFKKSQTAIKNVKTFYQKSKALLANGGSFLTERDTGFKWIKSLALVKRNKKWKCFIGGTDKSAVKWKRSVLFQDKYMYGNDWWQYLR